jgi:hypothetical protein
MKKGITFVGMDSHKVAIKLAVLVPGETKPVEWQLSNEKAAVRRMVRKVQRLDRAKCVSATKRVPAATRCSDGSRRLGPPAR